MRYLYVRTPSEEWGVDLETLEFVRPARAARGPARPAPATSDPPPRSPRRTPATSATAGLHPARGPLRPADALWDQVAAPYARLRTERLLVQVPTAGHGVVTLTCVRYPHDPQVRTAVNLSAQQEVSRGNARGILVARARKGQWWGASTTLTPWRPSGCGTSGRGVPQGRILTSPDSAEWLDYRSECVFF